MSYGSLNGQQFDNYTRSEILSDDTKTLFGLDKDSVPDQIFNLIGNKLYNPNIIYRWKRTKTTITYGPYSVAGRATKVCDINPYMSSKPTFRYSATMNNNGNLNNQSTVTLQGASVGNQTDLMRTLGSNFWYINSSGDGLTSISSYGPWRGPTYVDNNSITAYRVTINSQSSTQTEYVSSTNPSAYPNSGTQDGWTYTKLSPITSKLSNLATGTYTGTGTAGSNNKNSLTFDFEPLMLIVYQSDIGLCPYAGQSAWFNSFFWGHGQTTVYVTNTNGRYQNTVAVDNKTINWYNTSNNATFQLNVNNTVYNYICLG